MFTIALILFIFSLLPYLTFETSSELFIKLETILTNRSPPNQHSTHSNFCRIILFPGIDLFSDLNDELLKIQVTNTIEILSTNEAVNRSKQTFRLSPVCVHTVLATFKVLEARLDRSWIDSHVLNLKQEVVHFLFVGSEAQIWQLVPTDTYDQVKYKTALAIDTGLIVIGENSKYFSIDTPWKVDPLSSEGTMLRSRKLHMLLWRVEPYTILDKKGQPVGGFTHRLAAEFCQLYNSSCRYSIKLEGLGKFPNGSWQGFMGKLANGDGDGDVSIGIGGIFSRYGAVEFATPTFNFEIKFFTSPPRSSVRWQALLHPFHPTVWITALATVVVSVAAYWLHFSLATKYHHGNSGNVYASVILPVRTLLQQACKIPPEAKLLTVILMFYSMLITTAYNSNLISYLTFPEREFLPTTFEELAQVRKQYRIIITHNPGSTQSTVFTNPETEYARQIGEVLELEKNWDKCALAAATERNTVCISVHFTLQLYAPRNFTIHAMHKPFVESRKSAKTVPMQIALRWTSRYTTVISRVTGRLFATGHIDKWKQEAFDFVYRRGRPWMREQVKDKTEMIRKLEQVIRDASNEELKPFTMKNFVLCFGAWAFGLFVSSIVSIFEVFPVLRKGSKGVKCLELGCCTSELIRPH